MNPAKLFNWDQLTLNIKNVNQIDPGDHTRPGRKMIATLGFVRLILGAGAFFATGQSLAQTSSQYTKHDYEKCPAALGLNPDGVVERICPGVGGHNVRWTGEVDASSVEFGLIGSEEFLNIGPFFEVGETIEWRGPFHSNSVKPIAAIVRYAVEQSIAGPRTSKLVIYRLEAQKSCVMAVLDGRGADANKKARELADRTAGHFACGASKRIVE